MSAARPATPLKNAGPTVESKKNKKAIVAFEPPTQKLAVASHSGEDAPKKKKKKKPPLDVGGPGDTFVQKVATDASENTASVVQADAKTIVDGALPKKKKKKVVVTDAEPSSVALTQVTTVVGAELTTAAPASDDAPKKKKKKKAVVFGALPPVFGAQPPVDAPFVEVLQTAAENKTDPPVGGEGGPTAPAGPDANVPNVPNVANVPNVTPPDDEAPKKKKKKKPIPEASPAALNDPIAAAAPDPDSIFDAAFDAPPKKKKKKKVVVDDGAGEETATTSITAAITTSGASDPLRAHDHEAKGGSAADTKDGKAGADPPDDPDVPAFTIGAKKKKKAASEDQDAANALPWQGTDRDYTYTEMMERVFGLLREKNPTLALRTRHKLPPPQLVRVGTRKTMWANFAQTFEVLHRSAEHLMSFMLAELGTDGALDANQRFIVKGRFVPKHIESLLKKYIVEYVTCHMCRNAETSLTRDSVVRLYFIQCETCGSRRAVAPIKSGFHATTRSDRRKGKRPTAAQPTPPLLALSSPPLPPSANPRAPLAPPSILSQSDGLTA